MMKTKEEVIARITDRNLSQVNEGYFNMTVSETLRCMQEFAESYEPQINESCNHVLGAADESGICIKCGKKVCEIINNNLCQK